jgi:hypothetical protein
MERAVAEPLVPPGAWSLPAVVSPAIRQTRQRDAPGLLDCARQLTRDRRYDDALPHLDAILNAGSALRRYS